MQIDDANIACMNKKNNIPRGIPDLGKRLRLFRKSFGYSAQALAELIKSKHEDSSITRQVIFNIENGRKTDLTITELVYISDAMGLPYSALLCDLTQPFLPIQSGPFMGKNTYDVIDDFDPRKTEIAINDEWPEINQYLDAATELIQNIAKFQFARHAFLENWGKNDETVQIQLMTMEAALSFMEADIKDLQDEDVYIPKRLSKKVSDAKTEYETFKAKKANNTKKQ
uniref:Helix-turn-helix transcriptional regulator n=2 Tax=Bifidobacterium asteroides TaxID=1684 RepID=A0ABS3IWF8_9BIFI